jgi:aldehyde:ferredoxin oxidoreductase
VAKPNRLLQVDLTTGTIDERGIEPDDLEIYLGGSALAARLFFEQGGLSTEALTPDSPLYIMTGPLVGTTFPGSSRFVMCARSPLTGIWGESASGGYLGADLRRAGYDGIIFSGRSPSPVYLLVEKDHASLVKADQLWGLDTYDTIDRLRTKYAGRPAARVMAIGPAGERQVHFAAVCNDKAHYFGRTGMGAVMGSKHVKAVVVRAKGKITAADEEGFDRALKRAGEAVGGSMIKDSFHDLGTAAAMDMGMLTGDVPIKNWSQGEAEALAAAIGGPALHGTILKRRAACFACPIACKPVVEIAGPAGPPLKGPGPEYETCASFGTMILNDDLKAIAYINDLCNRLGMDTITCGATAAFLMDCWENELIGPEDTDGLTFSWGNIDAVIELVKKIAAREGIGDRAAVGSQALAESIGASAIDLAATVKGLELPMHDPRAFHGQGLAYMNSNRGACHLQHTVQAVEQGMVSWPEAGLEEDYPALVSEGKARMVAISEDIGQMVNAACICHFVFWAMGLDPLIAGLNAVTGFGWGLSQLLSTGRRSWLLKRGLNNLMGVTARDDRLPPKVLTPLEEGLAAGSKPDQDLMKKDYYAYRGLDSNGIPEKQVLLDAGLEFLAESLSGVRG